MNTKWMILTLVTFAVSACASMTWHEGSMIQYSQVQALENNQYQIEVMGGWDHDQAALERAVIKKARTECNGNAEIISSRMGTYFSASQYASGDAPKILSRVRCVDNS
ncbi:hypothetical protein KUC3_04780 [Alteromonas sp. KC3]|uniref:hypothetical protein n=1 Tax=unclassified Alteromonas TaxID=2614992 RepID=UPI0019204329|nr:MULTISPECIES: hypothetical protein [unclassified Alteromonas]BCO17621.1 hypothetical protein KUC3_04780 [Alteromonas sp. KC3]BCO21599.1 hypothetical protein KUC14_04680 [Alteromonas sp. KC14]